MQNNLWVIFTRKPITVLLAGTLLVSGCADFPGRCGLGISHEDCAQAPGEANQFPTDDAICRSYGFKFGEPDYARCRAAKASLRDETKTAIDKQWWQNPL
jgi:hypothetical protein